MNIVFFAAQYLPTVGGVERYTNNLAKQLCKCGHSVTVVTSSLKNLENLETSAEGIEIIRLPSFLFMNGRFPVIKPNKEFFKLTKKLWKQKFDIAVINTKLYPLSLYASFAAKRHKTFQIEIEHGTAHLVSNKGIVETLFNAVEHSFCFLLKINCKDFYGVSKACGTWLKHFGITAKGELYNAVNPDEINEVASTSDKDYKKLLNLKDDSLIISYAGRLIPDKGVLVMKQALPLIKERIPNAVMVFAGNGECYDELSGLKDAGLHLLGEVSYADSLALIKQSDIFLMPTRSEGFSCTVLEAAALRTPIITTATGGSPELLIDQHHGEILRDMSVDHAVSAVSRALGNDEWRKSAAQKSYQRLSDNFTFEKTADALIKVIDLHKASQEER